MPVVGRKRMYLTFFFTRDSYVSCGRTVFTKVSGWNILVYSVILTKSFNVPFQMKKKFILFSLDHPCFYLIVKCYLHQVLYKYLRDVLFQGQVFQCSYPEVSRYIYCIFSVLYFDTLHRKEGSGPVPACSLYPAE